MEISSILVHPPLSQTDQSNDQGRASLRTVSGFPIPLRIDYGRREQIGRMNGIFAESRRLNRAMVVGAIIARISAG